MNPANCKTNFISTDVLIIGGSLAGLTAAIKIKEMQEHLDVWVVDKGGIGWAGLVPTGAGHLVILTPDSNLDKWVKWVADRGEGLSNIDWLNNFGGNLYESIMELFNWGLAFMKNANGGLYVGDLPGWRVNEKMTGFLSHKVLLQLRKRTLAKGGKILDKTEMVDLLKSHGQIVGAVGFSIITGECYVFKSKATLIASGACRFKNRRLWTMNCGEMIAAAYRAGAQHVHSEFATLHATCSKECQMWYRGTGQQNALVNALGERIREKYFPDMLGESVSKIAYAMTSEVEAGRGPIYFDIRGSPVPYEEQVFDNIQKWALEEGAFLNSERILREKAGINLHSQRVEWMPGFIGVLGNIRVDLECKSQDIEGLWAVGDAIKTGLAMEGALPPGEYGGWGLDLAIVTGLKAGKNIARIVPEMAEVKIDVEEQRCLEERLFAPMTSERGLEPFIAVKKIQEAIVPAKYSVLRDEARLKESLDMIEQVQMEVLPSVKAVNPHELLKYHEAKSMALCATMIQTAALFRTETRGSHIRRDYPEKDDENWLKWTVIHSKDERMIISAVPVSKQKV